MDCLQIGVPKLSNQLLANSNVGFLIGSSGDIILDIDIGKLFGKLHTFYINRSELRAITFCTVKILNLLNEDLVWSGLLPFL